MKKKYKPGPGWKKLNPAVYEKGLFRIHIIGLIKSTALNRFVDDVESKAELYIKVNGGNRKRGLMAYANHAKFII